MSTPKALNSVAQRKLHEFRECGATLGYESNESSVEPKNVPTPRYVTETETGRERISASVTCRISGYRSSRPIIVIPFVTQGDARFATANLAYPGLRCQNAFGVPIASHSQTDHVEICITTTAKPQVVAPRTQRPSQ